MGKTGRRRTSFLELPVPILSLWDYAMGPTSLILGWALPIRSRVKGPVDRWVNWWRSTQQLLAAHSNCQLPVGKCGTHLAWDAIIVQPMRTTRRKKERKENRRSTYPPMEVLRDLIRPWLATGTDDSESWRCITQRRTATTTARALAATYLHDRSRFSYRGLD